MIKKLKILVVILTLLFLPTVKLTATELDTVGKITGINLAKNYMEQQRYDKELNEFIDQLGYDESRNNWLEINKIGAFGEWQFMTTTLKYLGYGHITVRKFRKDPSIFPPELQRQILKELIQVNSIEMQDFINYYEGLEIDEVTITRAGILAACHLGGPTSVRLFLLSSGNTNKHDIFHTSIKSYLERYGRFNLNLKLI
jgi:hypothetical protein